MKETRIRLTEEDHERLRIAAAHAQMSMAAFVKHVTLEAIVRQEKGRKKD